ncbi:MAG: EamA family transporter RarD [Friedmanniella sp.]
MADRERERHGIGYGLAAYGLWGAVPLFWPLVARAGSLELLAHRVVWSLVISVVLALVLLPKGWYGRMATRRTLLMLGLAAAVVSVNWGVYIWAVNHGQVVQTSLGYYINPILSILVGVIVLGERMARLQWVSVALAFLAVVVLTVEYGRLPWVSLVLAASFATYGVMKKQVNGGAVETLTIESALLTPVALGYLVYLATSGGLTFGTLGWTHSLLLVATGVVTVVPLLFFAASATRLPLSTLGLLQYLAPTLQFLLGILYFHETMSTGRWIGFGLVWLALMIMSGHGLHRANASRRARLVAEPV